MSVECLKEGRLIIVSNRLPFTAREERDGIKFTESAGGLVTGLSTFLGSYKFHMTRQEKCIWIGWPGGNISDKFKDQVRSRTMAECGSYPVFLSESDMEKFYFGFCNKTIWPLFHYFPSTAVYDEESWQTYQSVNLQFRDTLLDFLQPKDVVWIQDYHLMLLPHLLREKAPHAIIGFFLHIPFPSFEIFRLLPIPWRREILEGLLGADLIGFHTYEYMQHFFQSVLRILGHEHQMGHFTFSDHVCKVETYPMGIDFKKFFDVSSSPQTHRRRAKLQQALSGFRTILSVDRLDYSKGILNRLEGFELLLDKYPEYRGKLVLLMVVVPSRIGVVYYDLMKKQIEELVGRINGKFGSIEWTPVIYQYRHLSLYPLSALYSMSDVALVTPLRDGMNLIAKEYVASRNDQTGVLILSEMAGAAKELGEAIIVNPNDRWGLADALKEALDMPKEEQVRRNTIMQERLRRYDVLHWAKEFVGQLTQMKDIKAQFHASLAPPAIRRQIANEYTQAGRRLLLIDYDGTLVPFERQPMLAVPKASVLDLLRTLAHDPNNTVVIISGRDKPTLESWFEKIPIKIVAEHGMWFRENSGEWRKIGRASKDWKTSLLPLLLQYADRLPGSLVEEKEYSIAWHFRAADPDHAKRVSAEVLDNLTHFTANTDLHILKGNKVFEIRNSSVNKGRAALYCISRSKYDFIIAIGDDSTDEDLFQSLPANAYSLRVGLEKTLARYNLRNPDDTCAFLQLLIDTGRGDAV